MYRLKMYDNRHGGTFYWVEDTVIDPFENEPTTAWVQGCQVFAKLFETEDEALDYVWTDDGKAKRVFGATYVAERVE